MDFGEFLSKYQGKIKSNLVTWLFIGICVVASAYMELLATPASRPFSITDEAISNPFTTHQKYNDLWLLTCAVAVPLLILTALVIGDSSIVEKFHVFYTTTMEFSTAIGVTLFLTTFLKIRLAKLRPDFLARCGPVLNVSNTSTLYDVSICTAPLGEQLLLDGFKSCPSGHSSMALTGLGFITLWSLKRYVFKSQLKIVTIALCCLPLLLVMDIATSRISDFRHSYTDVLSGLTVGGVGLCFGHLASLESLESSPLLPL